MVLAEERVSRLEIIERFKAVTVARDPYVLACLLEVYRDEFSPYQLTTRLAGAGKTYVASAVIDRISTVIEPRKIVESPGAS